MANQLTEKRVELNTLKLLENVKYQKDIERAEKINFASNLIKCREILKLSRKHLSRTLGVSLSQYRKYEDGRDYMRMQTAMRFSLNYGVPFTWLFSRGIYSDFCPKPDRFEYWIPLQAFVGCCNDLEFDSFVKIISQSNVLNVQSSFSSSTNWPPKNAISFELDNYYSVVGQGLQKFRKQHGHSRALFAELLGIDVRTLASYEHSGNHDFSVVMAMRFWYETGINPLSLLKGTAMYQLRVLQGERMTWLLSNFEQASDSDLEMLVKVTKFLSSLGR